MLLHATTKHPYGNCYLLFESSEHLEDFQGSTIKETLSLLVFVCQFLTGVILKGIDIRKSTFVKYITMLSFPLLPVTVTFQTLN